MKTAKTAKTATAKPATAKPATAKPATAKPATAKPATAKPATAKPRKPKVITKIQWLEQLTEAVRANEKADDWIKNLALASLNYYSSLESFIKDKEVIRKSLIEGLTEKEQTAIAWEKNAILDSVFRKKTMDKVGKYWLRMQNYAFPPKTAKKDKTAKANAKKGEKAEVALEVLDIPLFAKKEGLIQALNACITGINHSKDVEYNREAVITSLQQIIKTLI